MRTFRRLAAAFPALAVALAACAQGSAGIGVGGGGGATGGTGGSSSDGGASSQGGGSSTGDGGSGSFSGATSSTSDSSSQATGSTGSTTSTSAQSSSAQTTGAGGGSCSESPCKLVSPQCGCPTGEMCAIGASGQRTCVTAGTAAPGAACGAVDCAPGGICLGAGNVGFCGEFCKADADCSAPAICALGLSDGNGGTVPNASICSSNCNPIVGTGCPTGMSCQIAKEDAGLMRFMFACNVAGAGTDGAACTTADDCAVNYGCYNDGVTNNCYRHCNVANDQCPGVQTCAGLQDAGSPIVINGISMGVCI